MGKTDTPARLSQASIFSRAFTVVIRPPALPSSVHTSPDPRNGRRGKLSTIRQERLTSIGGQERYPFGIFWQLGLSRRSRSAVRIVPEVTVIGTKQALFPPLWPRFEVKNSNTSKGTAARV